MLDPVAEKQKSTIRKNIDDFTFEGVATGMIDRRLVESDTRTRRCEDLFRSFTTEPETQGSNLRHNPGKSGGVLR
jgi:hypothetical protein